MSFKLTLVQKVALTSFLLLIVTTTVLSWLISQAIRQSYLNEQKNSVSQFIQKQANRRLTADDFQGDSPASVREQFDFFRDEITTPDVVRIKIYNHDGVILSSDQVELLGQKMDPAGSEELFRALDGEVISSISQLDKSENEFERRFGELLETYVPISFNDTTVTGVVEIYTQLGMLDAQISQTQRRAVIAITTSISIAFLLLFFIVRQASRTLVHQAEQLQRDIEKEKEYSTLKDEFIHLSSHQLRTPAGSVKWSLQLLAEDQENLTPQQREALKTALEGTETFIAIVNSILTVEEIQPDYLTFEPEPYEVSEVIAQIQEALADRAVRKKQTISFTSHSKSAKTNWKRSALLLVLETLVKNSIDYSPEKGRVLIELEDTPARIKVTVTDKGIGIPDEDQKKIFEKFFRASNAIVLKNAGSGLSLYISQKIAAGYGGSLEFTPLPVGTLFTLVIPKPKKDEKESI